MAPAAELPALLVYTRTFERLANTMNLKHNFGVKMGGFHLVQVQISRLRNKGRPLQMSDNTQMNLRARSACPAAMGDAALRGSATLSATYCVLRGFIFEKGAIRCISDIRGHVKVWNTMPALQQDLL